MTDSSLTGRLQGRVVNRVRLERALESTTGNDLNILWVNGGSCSAFTVLVCSQVNRKALILF